MTPGQSQFTEHFSLLLQTHLSHLLPYYCPIMSQSHRYFYRQAALSSTYLRKTKYGKTNKQTKPYWNYQGKEIAHLRWLNFHTMGLPDRKFKMEDILCFVCSDQIRLINPEQTLSSMRQNNKYIFFLHLTFPAVISVS